MNDSKKLTDDKFIEVFKCFNVPVSANELKTPTKEFVTRVFCCFLSDLQFNIYNPLMRPFDSIKHIETPDLYEEIQMIILLASTITDILRNTSNLNVTINDIITPKPKRTKKILNYLIIFWNSYLRKDEIFLNVQSNLKPELQRGLEFQEENDFLDQQYEQCIEILKNMKISKEELFKNHAFKSKKEKDYENYKETLLQEYQLLKEKENNMLTEMSNLDIEISTMKERLDEIENHIISSPEKINAHVQNIKENVKEVDQKTQDKEFEIKEKKRTYFSFVTVQEEWVKNIAKQQTICDILQSLSDCAQNIKSACINYEEENRSLKESLTAQERKETMSNVYDQKAAKIQLSKKKQIEEVTETLKDVQRQVSDEKKLTETVSCYISPLEEKINKEADSVIEIVEKCKKQEEVTEHVKAQHTAHMERIEKNFREDCASIMTEAKRIF